MRVALIWELLPEETHAFVIENPTKEQLELLEDSNGKFINFHENTESVEKISDLICDDFKCLINPENESSGSWASCKTEFPVSGPIDKIFFCGFML